MDRPRQLPLPLGEVEGPEVRESRTVPREGAERRLRVIQGEGQARELKLRSRDDLAGVLVGAAADMLLKRISPPRANEIQRRVEKLLALFDRVKEQPLLEPVLQRELDELESLLRETPKRSKR